LLLSKFQQAGIRVIVVAISGYSRAAGFPGRLQHLAEQQRFKFSGGLTQFGGVVLG
jgi:hypothetical protein